MYKRQVDTDQERATEISKEFSIPLFNELQDFLNQVDAVSIITPTPYHAKMAEICIENDIHVFIEKPITETLEEAERLLVLAKEKDVMIQVGHIERLNPALLALKPYRVEPKFLEIQRLAPYTARGTDVPVVLAVSYTHLTLPTILLV